MTPPHKRTVEGMQRTHEGLGELNVLLRQASDHARWLHMHAGRDLGPVEALLGVAMGLVNRDRDALSHEIGVEKEKVEPAAQRGSA